MSNKNNVGWISSLLDNPVVKSISDKIPGDKAVYVFLAVIAAGLAAFYFTGCTAIGGKVSQTAGKVTVDNPSPNTLTMRDMPDGVSQWTSNGTGPARFTDMTDQGVQTFQQGTVPRDVVISRPDGTRVVVSSGTDIMAKNVEFNAQTGTVKIGEFGTLTSEPARAANEALDRLKDVWIAQTQAERDAILAEVEASKAISESAKPVLIQLLQSLIGAP